MARKIKVTRINFVNFLRYAFLIIPCRSYSRSTQCNFDFLLNFIAHFHFLICHFSRPESNFNIEVLLGGTFMSPRLNFKPFQVAISEGSHIAVEILSSGLSLVVI